MMEPELCTTMTEVRAGVDEVDDQIVRLLTKRFAFMKAAARIKQSRGEVRDEPRKAAVIERVRKAAREASIPDALVGHLYDQLIEGSIAFELDRFDQKNDGPAD